MIHSAGRRLEDEKDNERIRREQQAEEARCSWLGSWISYLEKPWKHWEDDMKINRTSEVSAGIRHHGNIRYYH